MSQAQYYLLRFYNYSLNCGLNPLGSMGCDPFWGMVFGIAILLCAVVFIQAVLYLYSERVAYRNYQTKLIKRAKIADVEIMDSMNGILMIHSMVCLLKKWLTNSANN